MSVTHYTKLKTRFHSFSSSQANLFRWPAGKPYTNWQKRLQRFLNHLNSTKLIPQKRQGKRLLSDSGKFLIEKRQQINEIIQKQTSEIILKLQTEKQIEGEELKLELTTMLKLFWERKNVSQHIEDTIPDRRNPELITYSKESIMMSALSIFLFRMGSGNKYDNDTHDIDEKYATKNMAKFIDAPENRVPVIKTIENFLKDLEENSVNDLMIAFFKDLQQSKFFRQHPQIMPGDFFLLAADCVHTHTYDHPHHVDIHGNNDCGCCLKRVYNKGTENEKIKWVHNTLVFSFVFFGGLKIPIYRYPIHAKQVLDMEAASEFNYKQECELVALKAALPIIREAFPRMDIVLLLDGLYANRPVIQLAKLHNYGYIIVRKDACLTTLGKECDEQAATPNHKKNCVHKCKSEYEGWLIQQKYEWFNSKYIGDDVTTNVLRFLENRTKEGEKAECYKCEWLFSWRLSATTCVLAARQARARWEIEDLFNTLKNRGYRFKHDYSRDPRSCFNWQGLALFAFGIFELFRFSEAIKERGNWPQSTLADKLLRQLLCRPTQELFSEVLLIKRIQFRYHFVVELILTQNIIQDLTEVELRAG